MTKIKFTHLGDDEEDDSAEDDDDDCKDCCSKAFDKYPDAHCIVYDDEYCNDKDAVVTLRHGESQNINMDDITIESLSAREGCQLQVWAGI